MSSKYKILILTLIVSGGFLARDTVMISGPLDMMPTYLAFFSSLILAFFLVILTENKKNHNHTRPALAAVSFLVALMSVFCAYFLNPASYREAAFPLALRNNAESFIGNISNFGFLIILFAILFGFLAGSDKNLRTTYSYKSSKHISSSRVPHKKKGHKR